MTECLEALRRDLADFPVPLLPVLHEKARETHRSLDMQVMLATGDDLETIKERKACLSK